MNSFLEIQCPRFIVRLVKAYKLLNRKLTISESLKIIYKAHQSTVKINLINSTVNIPQK